MRKLLLLTLVLTLAVTAAPLYAGTVYVPYAAEVEIGGVFYKTRVWATNNSEGVARRMQFRLIQSEEDGTADPDAGRITVLIEPGATRVVQLGDGAGLLELSGAPQIVVSARLVPVTTNGAAVADGIQLPIISDRSLRAGGDIVDLQGWLKDGDTTIANLGLVNMGTETSSCEIVLIRQDGLLIGDPAVVTVPPLSQRQFDDVLGLMGEQAVADARGAVSCDQPFYAYASLFKTTDGNVVFIAPSASLESTLDAPSAPPPAPTGDFDYLSDIPWSNTSNIRSGPHKDRSGWDPHAGSRGVGGYKKIEINGVQYDKGISFFPFWGQSFIEWNLGGNYRRFTMVARIDDEKTGEYEWARVDRATDRFIRLERPSNGFRAPEGNFLIRISGGGTMRVFGDGQLLFDSGEIYSYGPAANVDVDVTGVNTLRVLWDATHHEQAGAPHRSQLPNPPVRVIDCGWHDLLDLADAKLFK
jgi:hypothetical protein